MKPEDWEAGLEPWRPVHRRGCPPGAQLWQVHEGGAPERIHMHVKVCPLCQDDLADAGALTQQTWWQAALRWTGEGIAALRSSFDGLEAVGTRTRGAGAPELRLQARQDDLVCELQLRRSGGERRLSCQVRRADQRLPHRLELVENGQLLEARQDQRGQSELRRLQGPACELWVHTDSHSFAFRLELEG